MEALRLLWRIVLRDRGPKAPQNQGDGGVAVHGGEACPSQQD